MVLLALSLLSLISGARGAFVRDGVRTAVATTTYPFVLGMNIARDTVEYTFDGVLRYDDMVAENAALKQELTALQMALAESVETQAENQRLREKLAFARDTPSLELEPVNVLEALRGMLTIDRGSVHGIAPAMPVLAPGGVVGTVIEVAPLTANVATLHHLDCRIGAMVRRNRIRAYDGIIHASGNDLSRICTMQFIDMQHDVREGDLVVTSPESLFPTGFPIGHITNVRRTGTLWKTAEVEPTVNPYSLDEVFVVRRAERPATDLGAQAASAEPPPEAMDDPQAPAETDGVTLAELRPIQERLAP